LIDQNADFCPFITSANLRHKERQTTNIKVCTGIEGHSGVKKMYGIRDRGGLIRILRTESIRLLI
jgi:hypothetical protein